VPDIRTLETPSTVFAPLHSQRRVTAVQGEPRAFDLPGRAYEALARVYLNAMERAEGEEQLLWQRVLERKHSPDDLPFAIQTVHKRGAVEATLDEARLHIANAKTALLAVPQGVLTDL
jgi:hypothetical protein